MNRRQLLASLVGAPAIASLLAACGDDLVEEGSGDGALQHPTGAADVILRVGSGIGGFVPAGFAFTNVPQVLVTGDGRVLSAAPQIEIFPQPLLPPINVRTINEVGIQRLLVLAEDADLLADPPDYSTEVLVTDVGDTEVIVAGKGDRFVHRATALGLDMNADGHVEETSPARQRLATFVQLVGDLPSVVGAANLGDEQFLQAQRFRFQAVPVDPADFTGQEPAPNVVTWPADASVRLAAAAQCAVTDDPALIALFTEATQITLFLDGDQHHSVYAVAELPGDAC